MTFKMIRAEEAAERYDENKIMAERFIKEVIEPKIVESSVQHREIKLRAIDYGYVGTTYAFKEGQCKDILDYTAKFELTKVVNNILHENGYHVNAVLERSGDERLDGHGSFVISWGHIA